MELPFTTGQFFSVIQHYNETVWPAQIVLLLLALAALAALAARRPWASAFVSGILAALWAWTGVVYHLAFFTSINPAAYAFGTLALLGAAAFVWLGVVKGRLVFEAGRTIRSALAAAWVLFALAIYPAWSAAAGHAYPELPTFGLPCPTTIFTIGLLTLATGRAARIALAVPIVWALVGGQAAFLLGVPPDLGLLAAGVFAIGLLVRRSPPTGFAAAA